MSQHLATGTEPFLDDLSEAQLGAFRADPTRGVLDVLGRDGERLHGEVADAPARVAARLLNGAPGDRRRAAGAGRSFVGHDTGVAVHHADALEGHAKLLGDDLREHRPRTLTQLGRSGEERDRRVGVDAHGRGRRRIRAGVRRRHAEPDRSAARGAGPLERRRETAQVVPEVGVQRPLAGHELLPRPDDVSHPQLHRIDPELRRGLIHLKLARDVALRRAEPSQ